MTLTERTVVCCDDNIAQLRSRYPDGLRFVVGDTHGEAATLDALMQKIQVDPEKDHVYFVGDYNEGGDTKVLLEYLAAHYQPDCSRPGFHLIRGNHERELWPQYTLENLPDIIVLRERYMTYYIVHAGMVFSAFNLINTDLKKHLKQDIFVYKLDDICVQQDAPLRQLIWSRRGLYSQRSRWRVWPSEVELAKNSACIIHGHSPYVFFKMGDHYSYGEENLFWQNQHIYFSQSLQSFNIDANVKGRYANGEGHRGLACICLESLEEIAAQNGGRLTVEGVKQAENFVFFANHVYGLPAASYGELRVIADASHEAKCITLDYFGRPVFAEA